jgi:hypothetical protein
VVDIEVKYKNNQIIWQVKELPFMKDKVFEFEKVLYQDTINTAFTEFELAIQNNKRNGLDFEIYPDIKFTGIDKLLKPI